MGINLYYIQQFLHEIVFLTSFWETLVMVIDFFWYKDQFHFANPWFFLLRNFKIYYLVKFFQGNSYHNFKKGKVQNFMRIHIGGLGWVSIKTNNIQIRVKIKKLKKNLAKHVCQSHHVFQVYLALVCTFQGGINLFIKAIFFFWFFAAYS